MPSHQRGFTDEDEGYRTVRGRTFYRTQHTYAKIVQRRAGDQVPHSARRPPPRKDGHARNSNDMIIGRAKACGLKAVVHRRSNQNSHVNQICTGLFITRINPRVTIRDLELHVLNTTGYRVKPEKLPTKYDSYSSFYVRCNQVLRNVLFDASIWPEGSMVKSYYSN
jgi:hypothetical protein